MGLFKSKAEKELDFIIKNIEMNMANNYKDAAQSDLKDLEAAFAALRDSGKAKPEVLSRYGTILDSFKMRLKGYTHKDQKPYW